MELKKPDHRKGPRFKAKKLDVIKESYKAFNAKYPGVISEHSYKSFFKLQCRKIQAHIVENQGGVGLPENLGISAFVFQAKAEGALPSMDTKIFNETGIQVPFKNFDTRGLIGSIFWTTEVASSKNRDLKVWNFKGAKAFRTIAKNAFITYPKRYKLLLRRTKTTK